MNEPRPSLLPRRSFLQNLALASASLALAGCGPRPPRPTTLADASGTSTAAPHRKLGVALVGLGGYSTGQLAPALQETRWCKLTGVVTGDREKGERWSRQYGFPAENIYHYDNMHELADNDAIDIVYVVTPPGLHHRDTLAAARAGKHVICEKPMANSVAECDEMIKVCREQNVKLSIGYRLEFEPHHQLVDRLAPPGSASPFRELDGSHAFSSNNLGWRADADLAGGGPLMDLGVYVIQAACRAAAGQVPLAVTAEIPPATRPDLFKTVEESIRWTMEFPGGIRGTGFTSYADRGNHFDARGPDRSVELRPAYSYGGIGGRANGDRLDLPQINQQAAQMDDFARRVLQDEISPVSGDLGRMHMAVIEAIYEAARTGRRVEIPSAAREQWLNAAARTVLPYNFDTGGTVSA